MTEIAVVGAGPAGVAAAVTAAQAGAQVTLIEEYARPGGQYFKQPASSIDPNKFPPSLTGNIQQGRELLDGLSHPNIDLRCNTLVWNVTPDRDLGLYSPDGPARLQAEQLIIASGAYERVMPFPGWTLPGVMTVGGAQLLLKGQGLLAGRRLLLAGTGPLLQLAGVQLLEAGAKITAIVELQTRQKFLAQAPKFWGHWDKVGQGIANQRQLKKAGVPTKFGYTVVQALGEQEVEGAIVARVDATTGRPISGQEEGLDVDTICLNFGFVPATELTRLAGCEQRFDPHFGSLATVTNEDMETSQPGIFAAGEVRGIGGVEVALLEGRMAGMVAARKLGYDSDRVGRQSGPDLQREWQRARAVVEALGTMFALKPGLCELAAGEVVVCRCEEVTAGAVRAAVQAGVAQLNGLKPWTRAGMGRCQGRMCGPIIAQLVAHELGLEVKTVGVFTVRPPIKPVPLSVVGDSARQFEQIEWEDHATEYGYVRR